MSPSKHSLSGVRLLRQLAGEEGIRIFTMNQARKASEKLQIKQSYVAEALYHLQKEGWIRPLKRGLYMMSTESGFGSPPHEFEIATSLVTPCAISHWSAMHYYHLTQQTPNKIFSIAPKGTAIPRSISHELYQYVQVKPEHYFGIVKVWLDQSQIKITDRERTLLDGLMAPQYCGDFQEVLYAFKMGREEMQVSRLIEYALRLNCATTKRLGWTLEQLGIQESLLMPLLERPVKGYRRLDPTGPRAGPHNKKWMIQENIGVV